MCSNKQTVMIEENGIQRPQEVTCRVCNDCINARKNDWVARCMAEKQTQGHALVMTLTYRDKPDGTTPERAKAFFYSDVQLFMKRLREDYARKYKARNEISFIIAGERGSQKGRVHWHIVLFSKRPLVETGKWYDIFFKPLKSLKELIFGKKNRYIWNHWPHGHVNVMEPDQGGMAYVLKYCLKDMFNVVKSEGTARITKAENHGASMFRMSKNPPIGFRWLEQKCEEWEQKLIVPPSLELKVPGYSGYWWPKKKQREWLLDRLREINEKRNALHGSDCPQWGSLLASVESSENQKDWERLIYGEVEEVQDEYSLDEWQHHLGEKEAPRIRAKCGGILICRHCWDHQTRKERYDYWRWWQEQTSRYVTDTASTARSRSDWYREKRTINPFCLLKDDPDRKSAFPTA